MQSIVLFLIIPSLLLLNSCSTKNSNEPSGIGEGEIIFNISYPYFKDKFMVALLPETMKMEFKDDTYKSTITKGGIYTTCYIANCKKETLTLSLDFGIKQIYCVLDKALTDTLLHTYAIPDILNVNNYEHIAGLATNKFMAIYKTLDQGYDCELYTSPYIKINNSNWCTPFSEIKDVLLGYEIAQYGLVMRFLADSINQNKIDKATFSVPGHFKKVSLKQMLYEMQEIFKSITK